MYEWVFHEEKHEEIQTDEHTDRDLTEHLLRIAPHEGWIAYLCYFVNIFNSKSLN